jgi:Flp pilus assembly secretin CpaC
MPAPENLALQRLQTLFLSAFCLALLGCVPAHALMATASVYNERSNTMPLLSPLASDLSDEQLIQFMELISHVDEEPEPVQPAKPSSKKAKKPTSKRKTTALPTTLFAQPTDEVLKQALPQVLPQTMLASSLALYAEETTTTPDTTLVATAMPALKPFYLKPEMGVAASGSDLLALKTLPKLKTTLQQGQTQLEVIQGQAKVITLPRAVKRVSMSNSAVASAVVVSPTQVQLIGNSSGLSSLLLWYAGGGDAYSAYEVVVRRDVSLLAQQIKQVAPNVNVTPLVARDTVILGGEVDSMEEAQLVIQLAKAFFSQGNAASGASSSSGGSSGASGGASSAASASSSSGGSSSTVAGSAQLGNDDAIINLMRVKGMPSTRLELVQNKLRALHPSIVLDVVPGLNGQEKALLMGKVPSTGYIAKAINITSLFYGQPGLKVLSGPAGNQVRSGESNQDFQTADAFSNNMDVNLLQGMVVSDASGNVVSLLEVEQKPQVRCRIQILDVSRQARDLLGMPFGSLRFGDIAGAIDLRPQPFPALNGQGLQGLRGVTSAITGNNISLTLQALQDKQLVKSLAEPTLTMMSGEKASFLAGGEIPVPVADQNGRITLEYKEFGIRLNLIATVTDERKIHLQVAPEVSAIDPSLSFTSQFINIPGIRSRRVQTTVEIMPGQSFVLGGLFNSDDTEAFSRFPGLGNLPIIGSFFRSNMKDKRSSELLVVIQPEILTSEQLAVPSP